MAPCLTHGDLTHDHLLLSEDGTRVTGVIDWGDVSVADPARDVAGLWAWFGGDAEAGFRGLRLALG